MRWGCVGERGKEEGWAVGGWRMWLSWEQVHSAVVSFCFLKQKTAYEMLRSLVGSEMCIRDSNWRKRRTFMPSHGRPWEWSKPGIQPNRTWKMAKADRAQKDARHLHFRESGIIGPARGIEHAAANLILSFLPPCPRRPVSYTHLTLPTIYPV